MFKKSQKIFNKEGNLTYKVSRFCKTCGQFADISFKNMVLIPQLQTGDQMPLHRNESSQEKILVGKGEDTFIKENHNLSL